MRPTPPLPGPSPLILVVAGLLLAVPLVNAEAAHRESGTGQWGSNGQLEPANATWVRVDQEILTFHVTTENGTRASCSQGNGTLTTPAETGSYGTCGGILQGSNITLFLETPTARYNGSFHTEAPSGATGAGRFSLMETTLGLIALAAIGGSGLLAFLLVRERRLTGHLARRLYERSRGKRAHKHPDHTEEERVRRILVRSKN